MKTIPGLTAIPAATKADPGLTANISADDIQGGADAASLMNQVLTVAIDATGVNEDGRLTTADLVTISEYIRNDSDLYATFVEGHGDDEGNEETGFHLVQGDGGTLLFQGKAFINTVADAIYHIGFDIREGRFLNEDGNANELVADVAGWLNYFVNGTNIVYGEKSRDTLYSGEYSEIFDTAADELFIAGSGNDNVWSGMGDDKIRAGAGHDEAGGGEGNDTLYGGNGNDRLWGNQGDDIQYGQNGDDTIGGGDGNDKLLGGAGNDKLWGEHGDDTLSGNAGDDELGGSHGNDILKGGAGNDKLWGEHGNDNISGGIGNDRIGGGTGNDTLSGNVGNDVLSGENGDDVMKGGRGDDMLWAGAGNDSILGGDGDDKIGADGGNDTIKAGAGQDTVWSGDGEDDVSGGAGNDLLTGDGGDDTLDGGSGMDSLTGGDGDDVIIGGRGADELMDWDANDTDTFVFAPGDTGLNAAKDVIKGFVVGTDTVDLSGFDGLSFAADGFTGNGPEVVIDGRDILIDGDGDGVADGMIHVAWVNGLSEADLLLL